MGGVLSKGSVPLGQSQAGNSAACQYFKSFAIAIILCGDRCFAPREMSERTRERLHAGSMIATVLNSMCSLR